MIILGDQLLHVDLWIFGMQSIHIFLQTVKEPIAVRSEHSGGEAHILCLWRDGFRFIGLGCHHCRHAVRHRSINCFLFAGIGVDITGFLLLNGFE